MTGAETGAQGPGEGWSSALKGAQPDILKGDTET